MCRLGKLIDSDKSGCFARSSAFRITGVQLFGIAVKAGLISFDDPSADRALGVADTVRVFGWGKIDDRRGLCVLMVADLRLRVVVVIL